jgi:hypothetical protein
MDAAYGMCESRKSNDFNYFLLSGKSFGVFEECESSCSQMKQELTNCHYLEDQSITLFGLKIYGKTTELF